MLKSFLQIEVNDRGQKNDNGINAAIFSKLKIANATTVNNKSKQEISILEEHQGKYPVIHITLKDVMANTYTIIEEKLKCAVSRVFGEHKYLIDFLDENTKNQQLSLSSRKASESDLAKFSRLAYDDGKNASKIKLADSLRFLSKLLM
jgi:hypothetical protein